MAPNSNHGRKPASLDRVVRVAQFRIALRAFLRQSEAHVRKFGLTPQRYLLLLTILGAPDRSRQMTVTDVAERMKLSRNAVSELASRAEREGLLRREASDTDARFVRLGVTSEGERRVLDVIAEGDDARAELAQALGVLPDVFAASHEQ
jgi:DNA-binding MarR family transcriptional regulator